MDAMRMPLRARKKAKIREALIKTSSRLFAKQGYTETTLEQICDECDVTVQTLLRYFGSKDDLLFANHPMILERFALGLVQAAKRKSSTQYWLKFFRSHLRQLESDKAARQAYRIIVGSPTLLARFYAIARQYEAALEKALSEEVGAKPGDDLYSTLFAKLIVGGLIEEVLRSIEHGEADSSRERSEHVADFIIRNFGRPAGETKTRAASKEKPLRRRVAR